MLVEFRLMEASTSGQNSDCVLCAKAGAVEAASSSSQTIALGRFPRTRLRRWLALPGRAILFTCCRLTGSGTTEGLGFLSLQGFAG